MTNNYMCGKIHRKFTSMTTVSHKFWGMSNAYEFSALTILQFPVHNFWIRHWRRSTHRRRHMTAQGGWRMSVTRCTH